MFINIEMAKSHGLEIRIERKKGDTEYLSIVPTRGLELASLDALSEEMRNSLGISEGVREELMDEISALIHHATIWALLKDIDESKR